MPKLRLKRSPAEEAEHDQRKARKAVRKEAKRRYDSRLQEPNDNSDRHGDVRNQNLGGRYETEVEGAYGPELVDDHIFGWQEGQRARVEEDGRYQQRMRMWGDYGDRERLDALEAHLSSYSHIPRRWRSSNPHGSIVDPQLMEEEEYAEWIRQGMWRRQHNDIYQEQQRQIAAEQARKARERELAVETAQLEAAALQERRRKKQEREQLHWHDAKERYNTQWKALLAGEGDENSLLFRDIPWPCINAYGKASSAFSTDDLTKESISTFLFRDSQDGDAENTARDKVRETLLRFHPDKFEGRVMSRVKFVDREKVQEAVGVVVRILNELAKSR